MDSKHITNSSYLREKRIRYILPLPRVVVNYKMLWESDLFYEEVVMSLWRATKAENS